MKSIKKLLLAATLAVSVLTAVTAGAQTYGISTLMNGGTNNVLGAATNTYTLTTGSQTSQYNNVGIEITWSNSASGTGLSTFNFASNMAGTTNDIATAGQTWSFPIAANGTSTVIFQTNLTLNALGYISLTSIGNTNASIYMTNISVKYSIKPTRGNL